MSTSITQSIASNASLPAATIGKRAVLYLRVSTRGQVNTDYDPEGISIPAQRLACERKAEQLGLTIVDEYADLGQSGTETTRRLAFNQMLDRIRSERDVEFVIVYKLSRFARNRIDDAMTMVELQKRDVVLISATEQIDDTAVGQLMHGILSSFNEFRSREDGDDIAYKMGQKAKRGGTLGKAPLGYLNTIERIDGRDIRSVAIDEERAPYVRKAFELCATGNYSMEDIVEELTDLGLTTRPTRKYPAGPVSTSKMSRLLRDRYYLGEIVYKGAIYNGRHEALLPHSLFEKVQKFLEGSQKAGERKRVHQHYLKGTLFCGHCRAERTDVGRLLLQQTASRHGGEYFYYFCRATQHGGPCRSSRHLAVSAVEEMVLEHYKATALDSSFVRDLEALVNQTLRDHEETQRQIRAQLGAESKRIMAKIDNLLDLAAEGGIAAPRAKVRIRDLEYGKLEIDAKLVELESDLSDTAAGFLEWLHFLADAPQHYAATSDDLRRQINQALFKRIYIADEAVVSAELQPEVKIFHDAQRQWAAGRFETDGHALVQAQQKSSGEPEQHLTLSNLLDVDLAQVSSKAYMVRVQGL